MQKLRYFLLYFKSYLFRYYLRIFVIILVSCSAILIFAKLLNSNLFSVSVSQGIVGTHTAENLPVAVTSLLSKPLVTYDSSGLIQPGLAASFEVNKEATEYTFILADNLFWTDGTAVRSQDLAIPIGDVEISTPNEKTIKFKLKDSYSPFPSLLTKPVFKKDTLVGVGPYRIRNIQKNEKNSVFVEKVELSPVALDLPRVVIRFYANEKIAQHALRLGTVQSLLGVTTYKDLLKEKPFKVLYKTDYGRIVTIFYNTLDPILSDENLRLALSYSAPPIADEVEAKTSIPPLSWAFNSNVKDYLDNPNAAAASLKKVQKKPEEPIILTVTADLKDVGDRVVESWNKNGIKAVLRVESGIPQNFQALLISLKIPADPDQYSIWHGTQIETNISKISLPRVDKDLEDGRKTTNLEQRKALYLDFQKILLDNAPATFLYFPKDNVIYFKKAEKDLLKVLDIQLTSI